MALKPRLNVDALARLEMASEKASITGRKPALPSALERAAQVWKAEQDRQERLLLQPEAESSVVVLRRVPLPPRSDGCRTDGEVAWRPLRSGDEAQLRPVMLNAATVSALARRLRAREWARVRRRNAPLGPDLETWAQTWQRKRGARPVDLRGQAREP